MTALDVADLVVIAGRVLGISPAAALDQLDVAAARAALAEAAVGLTEAGLTGADAGLAAAVLMRALLGHRPFPGDHQAVAVAAGLQYLALNGWLAGLDPPGAAQIVIEGLARGQLSPVAAAWLASRLSAYPAPPRTEAPMRTRRPGRRLFRAVNLRPRAGIQTPVTGFLEFTDDARQVVVHAREEAIQLGLDHPGPEQFLLALLDADQGMAAQALHRIGIRPDAVRRQVSLLASQDPPRARPGSETPLPMRLMPRAVGEAVARGHDYIGTEHILLGLFHTGDQTAARALASLGAGESEVRGVVIAQLAEAGRLGPPPHRIHKPGARHDEIQLLRQEVARLTNLLREHGINPTVNTSDRKTA